MSTPAKVATLYLAEPSDRLRRAGCGRLRTETDAIGRISKLLADPRRRGSSS
jgi:hypothetical protein